VSSPNQFKIKYIIECFVDSTKRIVYAAQLGLVKIIQGEEFITNTAYLLLMNGYKT
jgi:hypothetical protein